jgi:cyclomaltodextrinase / maltogenic alpha-amylase / neopullulanase
METNGYKIQNNPNKEDDGHQGFNSVLNVGKLAGITTTCFRGDGKIYADAIDHYPMFPDLERIDNGKIKISLRTWKNDVEKVNLMLVTDVQTETVKEYPMSLLYSSDRFDNYQVILPVSALTAAYFFKLQDGKEILYDGMEGTSSELKNTVAYPVVISDLPNVSPPEWAKHVVWYQIFPDRFRNGDTSNDVLGSHTPPWTSDWFKPLPWEHGDFYSNVFNRFYGGDIQGIMEKLPYLKKLGITAIYLNPMFMSPSIHGYDTMDYRHINPHFGYLEDTVTPQGETLDPKTWKLTRTDKLFLQLIQECHKNGIKVIIDGVFNHTGDQFWAFKDLLKNGKNSPYKDWYKVLDFGPPVNYQGWWGSRQLPEIKQDANGLVHGPREHIFNITRHWMDPYGDGDVSKGVDGWRLDVADLIAKPFWKDWCTYVRKINPDAYITGEIWSRASDWTKGDMFNATMNYPFAKRVYEFFVDDRPKEKFSVSKFDQSLHELLSWYPYSVNYVMQNLLDSHDTDRIASAIMNRNRGFDENNRLQDAGNTYNWHKPDTAAYQKLKLIVLFQMTFVGAPMVWYGDEVGMWGAEDPSDRKPMLWKDLEPYQNPEDTVNENLLAHYQKLIAIRNQHETLQTGEFQTLLTDDKDNVYAFRRKGKESIVVVLNNSPEPKDITLNILPDKYLYGSPTSSNQIHLPAWDGVIILEK